MRFSSVDSNIDNDPLLGKEEFDLLKEDLENKNQIKKDKKDKKLKYTFKKTQQDLDFVNKRECEEETMI
jgi:hypothetical protein